MARLIIKSGGFSDQVVELRLGTNRFGRSRDNDFQVEHPTISARHCEISLCQDSLRLHDCDSTNGTLVAGRRIKDAVLVSGQTFRLGDVEFLVETTEVTVAIPKFDVPRPAPPVVLSDGSLICPRHPHAQATHQCTHCLEVLCDACVHQLRRRGGRLLKLCPICSHACVPLRAEKPKKKSLLSFLNTTIRLPFFPRKRASK
jgi:hypothetical protein